MRNVQNREFKHCGNTELSNVPVRGFCKDNTSQDHFRSMNLYKEFAYMSEIE